MKLKNTILLLWMTLLSFSGIAQTNLVTNGDFSIYDPNCPDFNFIGNTTTWASCGVTGWTEFRGHPALWGVPNNPNAWMWSANGNFEALQTSVAFEQGKCYTVSFEIWTDDNNNANANTNGTINFRAANVQNGAIQNQQVIYTNTIGGPYLNNRTTITVSFTPTANFSTLIINPFFNGNPQVAMSVDNIVVEEDNLAVDFHFEDSSGTERNTFCYGETIFLDGANSTDEDNYFIDAWRRPAGSIGNFQYVSGLGWTQGELNTVNLTSLFNATNTTFEMGYEYEIKVAMNNTCNGWLPLTKRFTILGNILLDANFTIHTFCAGDGTISAEVTTIDPTAYQWWGLFETNTGGIMGGTQIGGIQTGNTYTFTGLSWTKNYYIKHGVWKDSDKNGCYPWQENRKIVPTPVSWLGFTTDFSLSAGSDLNGNVTVNVLADSNPVQTYHGWEVYDVNHNLVSNNAYCCNSDTASFSAGLLINTWYYVKHGIWNDCTDWAETRKYFRIQIQESATENNIGGFIIEIKEYPYEPDSGYTREINEEIISGTIFDKYPEYERRFSDDKKSSLATQEENRLEMYPNPAQIGKTLTVLTTSTNRIEKVELVTFSGKSTPLHFIKQRESILINLDSNISKGMYFIKTTDISGVTMVRQLAIE
ncbi:T9SS type A sorting domain-containing protein [Aquimarina sp. 2201CG1-2-11]|uniref:T9SS type A sorting domain-containing protein n=1 Tax=Aquimarina discodermiae TaxID=3231043 RepID=UPI003462FE86